MKQLIDRKPEVSLSTELSAEAKSHFGTEIPIFVMLLVMRQWAVGEGYAQYLRCPPDLSVAGGDAYSVRTVETEVEDGTVRREIIVTREPGSYQVNDAQNRLMILRNELASALKSERCFREQANEARADPAQREAARARTVGAAALAESLEEEIAGLEPSAISFERESWVFPLDLAGVRLSAEMG